MVLLYFDRHHTKTPSTINSNSQSKSECLHSILVSNNISMIVLEVALQRFCFEQFPYEGLDIPEIALQRCYYKKMF